MQLSRSILTAALALATLGAAAMPVMAADPDHDVVRHHHHGHAYAYGHQHSKYYNRYANYNNTRNRDRNNWQNNNRNWANHPGRNHHRDADARNPNQPAPFIRNHRDPARAGSLHFFIVF